MKKYILFTVLFFVLFVLIGILSKVIIVVKYGQGHEITIGKNEESNVPDYEPNAKQIISSIITYRTILPEFSEVTGFQLKVLSTLKVSSKEISKSPLNTKEAQAVEIPLMLAKPVQLPIDYYLRPEILYTDFIQHAEEASPKQKSFVMLAGLFQSQINYSKQNAADADLLLIKQNSFNVSAVEQTKNISFQPQTGVLNIARIHQVGDENAALQIQNGIGNISNTIQSGIMNLSIQIQKSYLNNAEINQSGFLNTSNQIQDREIQGGYNTASSIQNGVLNTSLQQQSGVLNHSLIIQSSIKNVADQKQSGSSNDAIIDQHSNQNIALQSQDTEHLNNEMQNKAEIYQTNGSINFSEQNQYSIGRNGMLNNAVANQNGSLNNAVQTQMTGNNHSTVFQTGNSNNAIVYQAKM